MQPTSMFFIPEALSPLTVCTASCLFAKYLPFPPQVTVHGHGYMVRLFGFHRPVSAKDMAESRSLGIPLTRASKIIPNVS